MNPEALQELLSSLIMSVGTHRRNRPLSPVEVAEGFETLLESGWTANRISDEVLLKDASMVGRFRKLLELPVGIRELVNWHGSSSTITMSTAAEIARLRGLRDKTRLADSVLEYGLSKFEAQQAIELVRNVELSVSESVERVVRTRSKVVERSLFIGTVTEASVIERLKTMSQLQRDEILNRVISQLVPSSAEYSARMGVGRYTVSGGSVLSESFSGLPDGFEETINSLITREF